MSRMALRVLSLSMKKYPGHKEYPSIQAYRTKIEASMWTFKNFPSNIAKTGMILRLSFHYLGEEGKKKKDFSFNQVKLMVFCYHILNYKTTEIVLMIALFLRRTTNRYAHSHGTQIHFSAPLQTVQDFWKLLKPHISYPFQWMGIIESHHIKGFFIKTKIFKTASCSCVTRKGTKINKLRDYSVITDVLSSHGASDMHTNTAGCRQCLDHH